MIAETPVADAHGPAHTGSPAPVADAPGSDATPVAGRLSALGSSASVCDRPLNPMIGGSPIPKAKTFAEMEASGSAEIHWLWHGFVAARSVTLMTGLWRSGKSTLLSVLLSRMKSGGKLAGRAVAAGRAVVISEEDDTVWRRRDQMLELREHVKCICRPFRGKPRLEQWQGTLDQIGRDHEQLKIDLLVIDGLANLSPMRSENESGEMLKTLHPLHELTNRGMGVWISHHPNKGIVRPGQAARGSGALSGFVDISLELNRVSRRNDNDPRRRLWGYSRFVETPPKWVIEMTPDGADFLSLGESAQPSWEQGGPVLKRILEEAEGRLTWKQILRRWPKETASPAKSTLHRWLEQLLQEREVLREGRGTNGDPFVYLLPGMELEWQQDLLRSLVGPPEGRRGRRRGED